MRRACAESLGWRRICKTKMPGPGKKWWWRAGRATDCGPEGFRRGLAIPQQSCPSSGIAGRAVVVHRAGARAVLQQQRRLRRWQVSASTRHERSCFARGAARGAAPAVARRVRARPRDAAPDLGEARRSRHPGSGGGTRRVPRTRCFQRRRPRGGAVLLLRFAGLKWGVVSSHSGLRRSS